MSYYKLTLDPSSVNCFINRVVDFVSLHATPSEYAKGNPPEDILQREFSVYISKWYEVLREVIVPNCDKKGEVWKIDESIKTQTSMGDTVFYIGELKQHAEGMKDRQFVQEAKDDIDKVKKVTNKYYDTPLGFTLFISQDLKEIEEVAAYAKENNFSTEQPKVKEDGYFAIITIITPVGNHNEHASKYLEAWNERLAEVKNDGKSDENYFHQ